MAALAAPSMGVANLRASASWNANPAPIPVIVNPRPLKKKNPPVGIKGSSPQKKDILEFSRKSIRTSSPIQENTELYLGYERWLPPPPQVKSPRSIYNAASLAYIGDCIYELYARRHFLFPPLSLDEYNDRVMEVVRCEAQDALLKKLLDDDFLQEEERDILRWGKNIGSRKTKTIKRAGVATYNKASSLETLVGYLYVTNVERLEELMQRLGFSTGLSNERIMKRMESGAV